MRAMRFSRLFWLFWLLVAAALAAGCGDRGGHPAEVEPAGEADGEVAADETLEARAARLAREILIADTHIDVPYRLNEEWEDVSERTEKGDFDYPRARAGGLDAAFMSIYVPASYQESGGAEEFAEEMIAMVEKIVADAPDKFALAYTPDDLGANFAAGKISLPMGMENGAPIEDDLSRVGHFFDRGIRYVTLTHSKNNLISDSSYEDPDERRWGGLSPFGREVVAEMNRLGMLIDVSHVSDDAFDQVIEHSKAPVLATHSSCRRFTPDWERNMSDDMIRSLAENGGVIHVNFGSAFLTEEANRHSTEKWDAFGAYVEENGLDPESDEARAFRERWDEEHPLPYATLADVADHIDHVVEIAGIDHVGLGSDFDGVGDSLPEGLKDVSQYPNLIRELLERGYTEDDVRKITSGNLLRVWREAERVARELQARPAA